MMPEIDGIEVARRIKGNESLPFIPIIMQTALDSTENKVEGLEAGADDYITKPIDFAELKARLTSMLRIKRLQEAAARSARRQLLEVERAAAAHVADGRPHGARQPAPSRGAAATRCSSMRNGLNEPFSLRDV